MDTGSQSTDTGTQTATQSTDTGTQSTDPADSESSLSDSLTKECEKLFECDSDAAKKYQNVNECVQNLSNFPKDQLPAIECILDCNPQKGCDIWMFCMSRCFKIEKCIPTCNTYLECDSDAKDDVGNLEECTQGCVQEYSEDYVQCLMTCSEDSADCKAFNDCNKKNDCANM
jgi:hypothetical protein